MNVPLQGMQGWQQAPLKPQAALAAQDLWHQAAQGGKSVAAGHILTICVAIAGDAAQYGGVRSLDTCHICYIAAA